jgi:general secretion pathway protein M
MSGLDNFKGWYAGLAGRDQRILRIGAMALALILLLWVLLPLHRSLGAARAQLRQQQEDLEWMRRVGPTLAAAGPGAGPVAATQEPLLVLVDRSARESGLAQALTGSQPVGSGAMRVVLEHADFNLLVGWLARLSAQHGVHVEEASVTGGGTPGEVNASVQLRPPG